MRRIYIIKSSYIKMSSPILVLIDRIRSILHLTPIIIQNKAPYVVWNHNNRNDLISGSFLRFVQGF